MMKTFAIVIVVAMISGTGIGAAKAFWDSNKRLKAQNFNLQTQIETNQRNVELLTTLLDNERENREAAQEALSELVKDVPDVIYSQELPPSIQTVLDRFHNRIRTGP